MKANRQSSTATGVAIARAFEHRRLPGDRILEDPYAEEFLPNDARRIALRNIHVRRFALRLFERFMPGTIELVASRGRYADELTIASVAKGVDQLVILGAGYDTAALRLAPSHPDLSIYEIDHPATQAHKKSIVERIFPALGSHIRFVGVNFERDDLRKTLLAAGFDEERRCVVTWMGVSYYLTRAAFESTLDTLSGLMAPGSVLAFDYVLPSVIDGSHPHPVARRGTKRAARAGEPFLLGLSEPEVGALMTARGFAVLEQVSFDDLTRRYTEGRRGSVDFARLAACEKS